LWVSLKAIHDGLPFFIPGIIRPDANRATPTLAL
jgi:hypothetical protein